MSVIDVKPGPVGQDDVGQPEILVGELTGVGGLPGQVEPARVPQRVLLLEVPSGPARPRGRGRMVGVYDLGRGDHGVRAWLPGYGNGVLGLDAHHAANGHSSHT